MLVGIDFNVFLNFCVLNSLGKSMFFSVWYLIIGFGYEYLVWVDIEVFCFICIVFFGFVIGFFYGKIGNIINIRFII